MARFAVQVDVALARPPRTDDHLWFQVEAPDATAAELIALQMACVTPGVVMPVASVVLDWDE